MSRVAARLNHPTVAMGFAGGRTGEEIAELLEDEHVRTWFTHTKTQTRTNAIIHDDENRQIRVSSPGPEVLPDEVAALELSVFDLREPEFLVIAGGLLKGMPEDFYLRLIRKAARQNIRVVADVDRELRQVVAAGVYLIKPNQYELERLTDVHIETYDDALKASRMALDLGVTVVVCSLGPLGAVLVTETEAWKAVPPKVQVDSAVGADLTDQRLSVLLGEAPGRHFPIADKTLPDIGPTPNVQVPAVLLMARPDVRAGSLPGWVE